MKKSLSFLILFILPTLVFFSCNGSNSSKNDDNIDNGHRYVDLGLPSGTKWADCNIGASSPTDYGVYLAWGETSVKNNYNWNTYKYGNDYGKLTKYCTRPDYGKNGLDDNKTELDLDDDVAHTQWGGKWRMPSKAQIEELIANTNSQWTTIKGVNGYLFKATNGNSIFLPAAGYRSGTSLDCAGSGGYYWSRTLNADYPYYAYNLGFSSGYMYVNGYNRYYGRTVRPVRP
ncbi:MAG: hypothetical protein IJS43_00640 [Bacteroidaceae bacterium]|nr:hypothetical protein [Bacteroidaceae bacterium]